MDLQNALTQTLYAQLVEEAAIFDSLIMSGSQKGSAYRLEKGGHTYWYWQVSTPSGLKKLFLGRDSDETRAAVSRLEAKSDDLAQLLDGLKRAASAFLASGGMANEPAHFRVMEKLSMAGLFRKGLILVGSHGFVSLGNSLGVQWGGHMKTTDMDIARSQSVAFAVPLDSGEHLSVPEIAREVDSTFFLVPELDFRKPSTTLMSRKTKVKIDFLTHKKNTDDTDPHYFADIDIAAAPLRFMDYLLSGHNFKGLIVGNYAIPAMLPDPARFAVHKLIIAQERTLNRDIKAMKDIRQANELLSALLELGKQHEIQDAIDGVAAYSGARSNLQKSITAPNGLTAEIHAFLAPLIAKPRSRKRQGI